MQKKKMLPLSKDNNLKCKYCWSQDFIWDDLSSVISIRRTCFLFHLNLEFNFENSNIYESTRNKFIESSDLDSLGSYGAKSRSVKYFQLSQVLRNKMVKLRFISGFSFWRQRHFFGDLSEMKINNDKSFSKYRLKRTCQSRNHIIIMYHLCTIQFDFHSTLDGLRNVIII